MHKTVLHRYPCDLAVDHRGECREEGETWTIDGGNYVTFYQVFDGKIQSSGPVHKGSITESGEFTDTVTSQVGGTHYVDMEIQPWEVIDRAGLDFWEGNVIKYVMRYRTKNGLEDLKKARHYLDYLINRLEKKKNGA